MFSAAGNYKVDDVLSDEINSPHWHRVAKRILILHSHVEIHCHEYRGLTWYLLEDTTSGKNHRFNPAAYQFIGRIDGKNTVQDIFDILSELLDEESPTQDEIIQLLSQLHDADLIRTKELVDTDELFDRQSQNKKNKIKQRFANPITQKIPLWDPENFLNKHFNKVHWIFSYWVAFGWAIIVAYGLSLTVLNWPQISAHFTVNALSPYNLLLIFILYPPIKFLHELGHAFSAKLEGGEVHEMGVNFMLLMPIPYVNASSSTHFRNKYKRMLVSAAGIFVEMLLASLGLILFLATQPGLIQNIGFNIFVIGGVSSLFFNGNPLLKYDAYYILADAVEIPNLYQRAGRYWRYLCQKYVLRMHTADSPVNAPGERAWFLVYGSSSTVYRFAVLWFVITIVSDTFFALGMLLAIWLITQQILVPLYKSVVFIVSSPSLNKNRSRAILSCVSIVGLIACVTVLVPIPSYTLAQGVAWQPDEALIKAEHDGFAGKLMVKNNQHIAAGTMVIQLQDPILEAQLKIAQAKVRELKSKYRAKQLTNFVEARMIKDASLAAQSELDFVSKKVASMSIKAFKDGQILLPDAQDIPGRFIRQGELLGYILNDEPATVRLAVSQDNIGQVRNSVIDISVKLANDLSQNYKASIIRQSPKASNQLPSAALTTAGGGEFMTAPNQNDGRVSLEKVFLIDLSFDNAPANLPLGTRVYVRFKHESEPLAFQWYRRIRQTFLRQFNA